MPTFKEIMSQYGYNPPEEYKPIKAPMGEAQNRYARDKFLAGVESEFQKMGFKPLEQKTPEEAREKSLWDYVTDGDIVDSFAAGTGTLAKYVGHAIEEYTRPDDMTPTQWHEQTYPFVKALQSEGQAMEERNAHQYEDNSFAYHANNIVQSAPLVLAILGATALGSTILRPVVGAGGTAAINYALRSGKARQLAWDLAKIYQGSSTAAKIARATIPTNARTLTALPIGIFGEAALEKQGVEEESLGDAIRNGTYRKDESELKAEAAGDEAFWENAKIVGLFNAPQYKILFNNKAAKGLLGKIKDTVAVAGSEAIEEVLQEIANLSALDKPIEYKRLRDAAIAGGATGAGVHFIKQGADYIANRGKPSEEETEPTFKELAKQNSNDESERYGQFRQEVQSYLDQNTYLGENGAGEGKYWVRNPNMNVSTEGMRPESLNALDMLGKFFFDYTGKPLILNAGTNGDHVAGEFSHANGWKFDIIDQLDGDGALITADYGRGSFLDQFIKYGRSLGLGMNFEGEGTSNVHLDVAVDGTQWDGNGDHAGGFNPRNVQSNEQSSPQWNQYRGQKKSQQTSQEESTKPLFDLNSQDSTTQKLLEQFANERFSKAIDAEDVETVNFFNDMFDDNSAFQNTPENRNAIINRYGDEFNSFVQKNSSDQAKTDSQQKSPEVKSKTKQEIPYDRDTAIIKKGREYLDDLLKKTDETSKANSWTLNSAIRNNDVAAVENILKQNNIAIPESKQTQSSQPQQDPVKENKSPENVLSKKLQQQIKVAIAPVKTGAKSKKSRQRQGNAII